MVLLRRTLALALLMLSFPAIASANVSIDYTPVPATVGVPYVNLPIVSGGSTRGGHYVVQGTPLPSWLHLDPDTGELSGTPTSPGQVSVFITVVGLSDAVDGVNFGIPVDNPGSGVSGPAPDTQCGIFVDANGNLTPAVAKLTAAKEDCNPTKFGAKPKLSATRVGKKLRITINGVPSEWKLTVRGARKKSGLKKATSGTKLATVAAPARTLGPGTGMFKAPPSVKFVRSSWTKKGSKAILSSIAAVR